MRSPFGHEKGFSNTPYVTLNSAVVAPIPSAIVTMLRIVWRRSRRSTRTAYRTSWRSALVMALSLPYGGERHKSRIPTL
jgi:hypothetical protein